jgi:hypothetical protein
LEIEKKSNDKGNEDNTEAWNRLLFLCFFQSGDRSGSSSVKKSEREMPRAEQMRFNVAVVGYFWPCSIAFIAD